VAVIIKYVEDNERQTGNRPSENSVVIQSHKLENFKSHCSKLHTFTKALNTIYNLVNASSGRHYPEVIHWRSLNCGKF